MREQRTRDRARVDVPTPRTRAAPTSPAARKALRSLADKRARQLARRRGETIAPRTAHATSSPARLVCGAQTRIRRVRVKVEPGTSGARSQRDSRGAPKNFRAKADEARASLDKMGGSTSEGNKAVRMRALHTIKVRAARELQEREKSAPITLLTRQRAGKFRFPDDRRREWAGSSAAAELEFVESQKHKVNRPGTWTRLWPAWQKAEAFLRKKMEADGRQFAAATLVAYPWYLTAVAANAFLTSTAINAVTNTVQAVRKAAFMSGFSLGEGDLGLSVLRRVCKQERTQEARKVMALSLGQVQKIMKKWLMAESATVVERMIAAAMTLGFLKLLRWSDCMLVWLKYIYWMGESGFAYAIVRRKNDVYMIGCWHVVSDTGKRTCFARRFKRLVKELYPGVQLPRGKAWGFASGPGSEAFVFRDFGVRESVKAAAAAARKAARKRKRNAKRAPAAGDGYKLYHKLRVLEEVKGDGYLPLSDDPKRTSYQHYLTRFRKALEVCCGLTRAQAAIYGTQSMRRGGANRMWKAGKSKEDRMKAAQWKTPEMDLVYLQQTVEDQREYAKDLDL